MPDIDVTQLPVILLENGTLLGIKDGQIGRFEKTSVVDKISLGPASNDLPSVITLTNQIRTGLFNSGIAKDAELNTLTLTNTGIIQNSENGDLVAIIQNKTLNSTLSIVGGNGSLAVNGERLQATSTAFALGPLNVTIRQTLGSVTKDQTFTMTVYAPLSGNAFDPAQIGAVAFEDLFTSYPDIYNPSNNTSGKYATFYAFGADNTEPGRYASSDSRTLSYSNGSGNAEAQTYVDTVYTNGLIDPFQIVQGGGLIITARATPPALLASYNNRPVVSGMLRTRNFTPIYGCHEVRFLNELKPGYWSAAWLYEKVGATGAEFDTQESGPIFGHPGGDYIFQNTHNVEGGLSAATQVTPRPDQAFRTARVLWKDEAFAYYIDKVQVVPPTVRPASMNTAMCLLLDLALGWFNDSPAGAYDPNQLPYKHYIDRQRFYSISGTAPSLLLATPGTVSFPLVFTSSMPSGVGHVRNSDAYAPTSSGGLTKFAAGQPARTDLGILVEPAGVNLLSGLPTYVINASLTSTGIADPAGGTAGVRLTDGGTGSTGHLARGFATMNASAQYAVSTFVKRAVGSANLNIGNGSRAGYSANFNPSGAGTITQAELGTSAIKAYGAWYRVQTVFSNPASGSENIQDFYITKGTTGSGVFYTADGTALDFWGTQLELGGKVTSPMPSGSRSATSVAFKIPAGITTLTYTFDDNTTQAVTVTPNSNYYVPTNLNRSQIKQISAS